MLACVTVLHILMINVWKFYCVLGQFGWFDFRQQSAVKSTGLENITAWLNDGVCLQVMSPSRQFKHFLFHLSELDKNYKTSSSLVASFCGVCQLVAAFILMIKYRIICEIKYAPLHLPWTSLRCPLLFRCQVFVCQVGRKDNKRLLQVCRTWSSWWNLHRTCLNCCSRS